MLPFESWQFFYNSQFNSWQIQKRFSISTKISWSCEAIVELFILWLAVACHKGIELCAGISRRTSMNSLVDYVVATVARDIVTSLVNLSIWMVRIPTDRYILLNDDGVWFAQRGPVRSSYLAHSKKGQGFNAVWLSIRFRSPPHWIQSVLLANTEYCGMIRWGSFGAQGSFLESLASSCPGWAVAWANISYHGKFWVSICHGRWVFLLLYIP